MSRRISQRVWIPITFLVLLGFAGPAWAEQGAICPICKKASSEQVTYSTKASYTLARGTANTLLGWTELIRQPAAEAKEGGNVFVGLAKGVGHSVTRTLSGVGEVLTFWTPKTKTGYVHFANDCPVCMGKKK